MNGIQNGKNCNIEKPFPGCLGRVVNLFDKGTGVAGNRLLTDKPHNDGSRLSRSRSDVSRMSPTCDQMEDKVIVSQLRRTSDRKSIGTPMKMLIAQEMSKEMESRHNPPSVVAKLMGLDALPQQQPNSVGQRGHSRGHSWSHSGVPLNCWQQEHGFLDRQIQCENHQYLEHDECKDVYETWQQSEKAHYVRDKSLKKGRYSENTNEKNMALVRQKFLEAKRLATDEKLRQSKQFQDALEVLSSNKDLFLQFLQEPNSMFSQHFCDLQSTPPPRETKRITVLRPSKMVDGNKFDGFEKKGKQMKKVVQVDQVNGWENSSPGFSPPAASWKFDANPTQPTRIVVLKPSSGKPHDIKALVSSPLSPRIFHCEEFYGELEDDEVRESRAKEITRHMHEDTSRQRSDETLRSSVFSNGYNGDESSSNKSENENAAENLSDSEMMSPASRHSWDYINRFDSPYSSSSFSRTCYSPESSVCREAKKRLSERWAMMASNESCQEQKHVRGSSSTLGEMLALSDLKNAVRSEDCRDTEQEPRGSTSSLTSDLHKDKAVDNSPTNLLRSKSVPVSSTVNNARLNIEVLDPEVGKTDVSKEMTKARNTKSSFKEKVSVLFFSINRKTKKDTPIASPPKDETPTEGMPVQSHGKISDDGYQSVDNTESEDSSLPGRHGSMSDAFSLELIGVGPKQAIVSPEAGFPVTETVAPVNSIENPDQPSPISVLEPPFEEDCRMTPEASDNLKPNRHGKYGVELPSHFTKSNLIDKSLPIESIARTLSWDDSCTETATSHPLEPFLVSQRASEEEEEWCFFVQTLLSTAGLNSEVQCDSFFTRWHSPESPLDPSLRDKYVDLNDKGTLNEARLRQRRSTRKLVFDCVNATLVEMAGYGSETYQRATCIGAHCRFLEGASSIMVDRVWALMKEWFSGEVRCVSGDGGDNDSLVVERVVRKEVAGKGWVEHLRLEIDIMGTEIEGKLLEELVHEAVVELIDTV